MTTTTSATATPAVAPPSARLRTRDSEVRAIPAMLRSEFIKLVSLRSMLAIVVLNTIAALVISWAIATFGGDETRYILQVGFFWTVLTAIVAAVGGVLLFTSEVQHGTLAVTLAAQPARWVIALAKAAVAAGFGLVAGMLGLAAGLAGAAVAGIEFGETSSLGVAIVSALLYTTLGAMLGLAVGMLARHSAFAVAGLLVWSLVIEGLLSLFIPLRIARFLPFLAGDRLVQVETPFAAEDELALMLSRMEAGLVFGGYTLLALVVATILFSRRDAP